MKRIRSWRHRSSEEMTVEELANQPELLVRADLGEENLRVRVEKAEDVQRLLRLTRRVTVLVPRRVLPCWPWTVVKQLAEFADVETYVDDSCLYKRLFTLWGILSLGSWAVAIYFSFTAFLLSVVGLLFFGLFIGFWFLYQESLK